MRTLHTQKNAQIQDQRMWLDLICCRNDTNAQVPDIPYKILAQMNSICGILVQERLQNGRKDDYQVQKPIGVRVKLGRGGRR
jgi:hypothetical protein